MTTNQIRPIEWTSAQVQAFWDWYAARPAIQRTENAVEFSRAVLAFARRHVHSFGTSVDYACGLGVMTQQLVAQGVPTWALDVSETSTGIVKNLLQHQPAFLGAHQIGSLPTSLSSECANTVFLIETIEHLNDKAMTATLGEVHRLLCVGGHLIITTPNDENLAASAIMCPNCLCEFHRGQHVRSWSAQSLSAVVAAHGFTPIHCAPTYFADVAGWRGLWQTLRLRIKRHRLPNLALVAQKH